MSKTATSTPEDNGFSEQDMTRARSWFEKGQTLASKKNYDYAIEAYISGLEFWPEAVEEGHKPCWAAAKFRGKQKIGMRDQMKYKTSGKDAKKAMLNAEMLLTKDTSNTQYMEALFKNAAKGKFHATVMWIGEILDEALIRDEKSTPARFQLMREVYEEMSDEVKDEDPALAIAAMDRAVNAMDRMHKLKPTDMTISTDLRDLAGKLTIMKGKYGKAESFRDSIRDGEKQRDLHDKERIAQSDVRMDEMVAKAREAYEANPNEKANVTAYVDLLTRREREDDEKLAIDILTEAFEAKNEYSFKQRADELLIKQARRAVRSAKEAGDPSAVKAGLATQLKLELEVYRDQVRQFPTDLRMKFSLGKTMFQLRMFDDAIPILQEALEDPKTRLHCSLILGRCFFENAYHTQAGETFQTAIEKHETPRDDLGKELYYWLGRAYEEDGKVAEALKTYGQLIQWDYNYRKGDVRKRIDDLRERGKQGG